MTRNTFVAIIGFVTIALLASGGASQQPRETDPRDTQLRLLRAENNLLRAQIKSLKKELAAKNPPSTKPAAKATTSSKPKKNGTLIFTIHEDNPKWWSDPSDLALEIRLRTAVRHKHPKESPSAWLKRNGNFIGRKVDWTLGGARYQAVSEETAGQKYYRALKQSKASRNTADSRRPTLKRSIAAAKGNHRTKLENELAVLNRSVRRLQTETDLWKVMLDAKGGTIVTAYSKKDITVRMVLPGSQLSMFEKHDQVNMQGEITTLAPSEGSLHITVSGEIK